MKNIVVVFILIILSLIGGAVFAALQGKWGIFVPLVIGFPVTILVFVFTIIRKFQKNKENLLKNGESGIAKILSVNDTGVTINNNPRIAIHVEVKPRIGSPFNAKVHALLSRINAISYQPGMLLNVKFDPNNNQNIIIESVIQNDSYSTGSQGKMHHEIKPLVCPTCGGQLNIKEIPGEEITHCNYCGTALDLRD